MAEVDHLRVERSARAVHLSYTKHEGDTYGLDGERLTDAHGANRLVLRVVRHVRGAVKEIVDAVPAVRAHNRASVLSRNRLAVGRAVSQH